jgi:hypothetical protein
VKEKHIQGIQEMSLGRNIKPVGQSKLDEESSVSRCLPTMMEMGIKERDSNGLNRFRAAIATRDPQGLKPIAERIFSQLNIHDDKVHLHIVDSKALPY